jgi:hypothetical protein
MDANREGAERERTDTRRTRRRRMRRIQFVGQMLASALSGAVTALLALVLAFFFFAPRGGPGWFDRGVVFVTAAPFEERTARGNVNASAIVPLSDSHFLIVDDLTDDAFFELAFTPDGHKAGPLVRRPVAGLSSDVVQDLEDATVVDVKGHPVVVAVSSLEADEGEPTDAGLVRVAVGEGGALSGAVMPGFRDWLFAHYPMLQQTRGGPSHLDVQGIVWDPRRSVLLLGARSATMEGKPLLLPIRVRDWAGPWTTENLESGTPIQLQLGDSESPKGISGIAWDEHQKAFMFIVNDVPPDHHPYALYTWDGGDSGAVVHASDVLFDPRMRPEGIAFGTIGGRWSSVLVDDNGGYYVFWQDEKTS